MAIGYRPKGESGPAYHPDRDYAYTTPTIMKLAIERMDSAALPEEVAEWKKTNAITEAETIAVVEALARAQRDFVNAADPVSSFEHALRRRDFYDVRYPVRQFLFASIGEVFCAAWFHAVREVTRVAEHSPAAPAMADFMAAVSVFASRAGQPAPPVDATVAQLQLTNDVLQSRLRATYDQLQKVTALLAEQADKKEIPQPATKKSWLSEFFSVLKLARTTNLDFSRKP